MIDRHLGRRRCSCGPGETCRAPPVSAPDLMLAACAFQPPQHRKHVVGREPQLGVLERSTLCASSIRSANADAVGTSSVRIGRTPSYRSATDQHITQDCVEVNKVSGVLAVNKRTHLAVHDIVDVEDVSDASEPHRWFGA